MEEYKTKQEVQADLAMIYDKAIKGIRARKNVMIKDKQGIRVAPEWVVVKECVTLLNRINALEDIDKRVPVLNLDWAMA